jgi:hypothetical protein
MTQLPDSACHFTLPSKHKPVAYLGAAKRACVQIYIPHKMYGIGPVNHDFYLKAEIDNGLE